MISINAIIFSNYMICEVYRSQPWRRGYPADIRHPDCEFRALDIFRVIFFREGFRDIFVDISFIYLTFPPANPLTYLKKNYVKNWGLTIILLKYCNMSMIDKINENDDKCDEIKNWCKYDDETITSSMRMIIRVMRMSWELM